VIGLNWYQLFRNQRSFSQVFTCHLFVIIRFIIDDTNKQRSFILFFFWRKFQTNKQKNEQKKAEKIRELGMSQNNSITIWDDGMSVLRPPLTTQ